MGGKLSLAGNNVTLLGRQKFVNKVNADGLSLLWQHGMPQKAFPRAVEAIPEIENLNQLDLVFVTVKSFDTVAAMKPLVSELSPETQIISMQNGVGNEELLMELFPSQPIIAGSITFPVSVPDIGTIDIEKEGAIGLAAASAKADVDAAARALRQSGFDVTLYADYRSLKWSKLLMNIICNAIPAILDMPPAEAISNIDIFNLEIEAIKETLAVLRAANIPLVNVPGYPVLLLAWATRLLPRFLLRKILRSKIIGGRGNKLPSLQIDLRRGRNQSEVAVLNKMVADTGKRVGESVPVNETIGQILGGIVAGDIPNQQFLKQPAALIGAVANAKKRRRI